MTSLDEGSDGERLADWILEFIRSGRRTPTA